MKRPSYTERSIEVIGTLTAEDGRGTAYTLYRIQVTVGTKLWRVEKRFSQFKQLSDQLRLRGGATLPPFPASLSTAPWTGGGNMNPDFIAKRAFGLQAYVRELVRVLPMDDPLLYGPHGFLREGATGEVEIGVADSIRVTERRLDPPNLVRPDEMEWAVLWEEPLHENELETARAERWNSRSRSASGASADGAAASDDEAATTPRAGRTTSGGGARSPRERGERRLPGETPGRGDAALRRREEEVKAREEAVAARERALEQAAQALAEREQALSAASVKPAAATTPSNGSPVKGALPAREGGGSAQVASSAPSPPTVASSRSAPVAAAAPAAATTPSRQPSASPAKPPTSGGRMSFDGGGRASLGGAGTPQAEVAADGYAVGTRVQCNQGTGAEERWVPARVLGRREFCGREQLKVSRDGSDSVTTRLHLTGYNSPVTSPRCYLSPVLHLTGAATHLTQGEPRRLRLGVGRVDQRDERAPSRV